MYWASADDLCCIMYVQETGLLGLSCWLLSIFTLASKPQQPRLLFSRCNNHNDSNHNYDNYSPIVIIIYVCVADLVYQAGLLTKGG